MAVPLRQVFFITSTRRFDTHVSFNSDDVLAAATAIALAFGGLRRTA